MTLGMSLNIFRLLGDFSHLFSKLILIATIHSRHSAEGISLLTQSLYLLVFLLRYLDLFSAASWHSGSAFYNTPFKLIYILTSAYILYLMFRRYARTRESETEYKLAAYILCISLLAAPVFMGIFKEMWTLTRFCEQWSLVIEAVAVLPQITLLSHTAIPTAITSWYLVALGSYRAWYILNWIWRTGVERDGFDNWTSVVCGVVQTLVYVEFAYIYWNRQKVKLGRGGVLDREEFARGLVLGRLLGGERKELGGATGGWRGGVSVSADDFVVEDESGDELEDESGGSSRESEDVERGLVSGRK